MKRIDLNRRLVLERAVRLDDGAGGFAMEWQPVGTIWAEVVAGTGREASGIEVPLTRVPYRITVRGAPVGSDRRPLPEQRFRQGSRIYNILAVTERDQQGHYLLCHAQEEYPV